jgi:uncharacterized membrane protein YcjF (UPF0283 family)
MLVVAASYPFLEVLWDILIVFAWVIFIWIAITVLIDVFRRHDISGWAKAAWVVLVVILPWIGVLAYLIFNHDGMADRSAKESRAAQAQFDDYVRQAAGSGCATAVRLPRTSSSRSRQRHSHSPGGSWASSGIRLGRALSARGAVGLVRSAHPGLSNN